MKNERNLRQSGITLVALVITIIILLILAGIAISTLVGENGLVTKTKLAQEEYQKSQAKEELQLKITELRIKIESEYEREATLEDFYNFIAEDAELTFINATYKTQASLTEQDTQGEYETIKVLYKNYIFTVDTLLNIIETGENTDVANVDLSYEIKKIQDTDDKLMLTLLIKLQSSEKITKVELGEQVLSSNSGTEEIAIDLEIENNVECILKITTANGKVVEKTFKINVEDQVSGKGDTSKNRTLSGETEGYSYSDPVIPVGFVAINTEDAYWGYQEDGKVLGWNKGLVIEDAENGNQFVWVPVKDGIADNGAYSEDDNQTVQYKKWCTETISYESVVDNTLPEGVDEREQITKYGGFYISRYITNFENESDKTGKIVSKRGVNLGQYNYGQDLYIQYSEEMYSDENLQSSLITGTQWDTLVRWLIVSGIDIESTEWGNFGKTDGYLTTGYSEDWKVKNIYDLTGSVITVTNELSGTNMIVRGAYYVERVTAFKIRRTGIGGWGYGSRTVLNIK